MPFCAACLCLDGVDMPSGVTARLPLAEGVANGSRGSLTPFAAEKDGSRSEYFAVLGLTWPFDAIDPLAELDMVMPAGWQVNCDF